MADGIPDLVATNSNNVIGDPGTMTVLLGKGDGTFTPNGVSPVTVGKRPHIHCGGETSMGMACQT